MANEVTIRLRDGDMAVLAAPRAEKAAFRMSPQVMLAAAAGAVIGAIVALLVDIVVDTNFAEVWLVEKTAPRHRK